jgi:arylformamidase
VDDLQVYLDEYASRSAAARQRYPVHRALRYGPCVTETLDYFSPRSPRAPLHVFVHGGFWQMLSKDESAFTAPGFLDAGAAFAAVNYGLAPAYTLDTIVGMVRRAVCWLHGHGGELGFDPDRLYLSGSSAGAHLVAMALLPGPAPGGGDASRLVAGATLLSGVYDLEPVSRSYVNDAMGLDAAAVLRNSPVHHLPDALPPVIIARGGVETDEFIRQHQLMAAALGEVAPVTDIVEPTRNHFDLPYDLANPGTGLGRAVLAQMWGGGS